MSDKSPGNGGAVLKGQSVEINQATPTVSAGQIGVGTTTATTATAGTNGPVPPQVVGYLVINIGGTPFKLPYFAN